VRLQKANSLKVLIDEFINENKLFNQLFSHFLACSIVIARAKKR